jgi:hypothetical protein
MSQHRDGRVGPAAPVGGQAAEVRNGLESVSGVQISGARFTTLKRKWLKKVGGQTAEYVHFGQVKKTG